MSFKNNFSNKYISQFFLCGVMACINHLFDIMYKIQYTKKLSISSILSLFK